MVVLTQVVLNTAVALLLAAVVLLCDWAPIASFSLFRNAVYLVTLLHSDTPDNSCTFLFKKCSSFCSHVVRLASCFQQNAKVLHVCHI